MGSYSIRFGREAEADFRAVPFPFRRQVNQRIARLKEDPRPSQSQRISDSAFYRLRVGSWRALYEIDEEASRVIVHGIQGTRNYR